MISRKISTYWILTKPRLWFLLVYTGISGFLIASNGDINLQLFMILFISLVSGTAGANVVTSYIDRDIDSIMERTRNRPLPRGEITPKNALIFGLFLVAVSIITSALINIYTLIFMLFGLFDNIIIYSLVLKRRNPLNIVLGSFSGGCPVVIGYTAYANNVDALSIILAALIVVWTPVHIWSLALYYRDDYKRAGVPMLPVVTSEAKSIRCIASTAIFLILFSYLIPVLQPRFNHYIYLSIMTVLNILLGFYAFKLLLKPDLRTSWKLFKLTSPYLGIIFTVMVLLSI